VVEAPVDSRATQTLAEIARGRAIVEWKLRPR